MLTTVNSIYSQKYRAFDSTTVWATFYYFKVNSPCYMQYDLKYTVKGYELNNGNVWLKVYSSTQSYWGGAPVNCVGKY